MVNNSIQYRNFLRGSLAAIVTPMDIKGQIDKSSLKKLIDYHVNNGTTAIVSVGTTGESTTLDHSEHLDVVLTTLEYADGRIPIIAGGGANATKQAIALTKSLEKMGVVACLAVTPYYNKPSQEGLYQHFKAIAEQTDLPQILYNVPSRTGCDLLPETVARLAKLGNIVALKEASGDLSRVNRIRRLINDKNFILLSGDDATMLEFMQLGGQGVISVTANIAAKLMAEICKLALSEKYAEAHKLNDRLSELHHQLFIEPNPIPVKWACYQLGLINSDTLRLPMTPLTLTGQIAVQKALKIADLQKI
ncbi:4-hydroxy-tetrahydrodipicolinate synthase [Arsenophonus endosymbiont of Bemisia tabaci]|uniref:4-hydroxy-tetrahydrodipicolinate synthase n=1 Tax=Arsenophonus endosymbiont of Bemisia tabaci TaxID=536059 RepID=UPI0015F69AD0|nr:4-hydroxy-tetrahydrodipicolinate synthase [Arsenophonus endosymbiont of Bemisia tabaci]CAA2931098.1 4-hydroxy-tetrahydrodipicolinate synthase [Arsenophonus endosymbiont of Bemisia tabaci Q2]